MSVITVTPPYPLFTDVDGTPLENGMIYVGEANLEPIGNPVALFWDEALTIPAAQPIRTLDGYPVYQGTPSQFFTAETEYSILIKDRKGGLVFSIPEASGYITPGAMGAAFVTYVALAANTGAALVGTSSGDTVQEVLDEQATKLARFVLVTDFGAVGDGVTNDTVAIQAALDSGHAVYAPAGTYLVGTLDLPGPAGVFNDVTFIGEGPDKTVLQAAAANTPILRKAQVAGAVEAGLIGHFSLKAHASGSTGPAFDCSGFRNVKFAHIMGISTGGAGFASLFDVAASPYLTYGCTWEHCGVAGQTGWAKVWRTHNNGAGAAANPNACTIRDPWIYSNTGMTAGIDLANSTLWNVEGGLIESAGDYGIILGSRGKISGVWFETQAIAPIQFQTSGSVISANNLIEGCNFSGFGGNIAIPSGCAQNTFLNCDGVYTITPVTASDGNTFINAPHGGAVVITKSYGPAGTLTKTSDTVLSVMDGTRRAIWTFQASGGTPSNAGFALATPAGFNILNISASFYDPGSGVPAKCSFDVNLNMVIGEVPNTNLHQLVVLYRYQ